MEHKAFGRPSTVSRLPKFGSRPVNIACSLPNGTVHSRPTNKARSISGTLGEGLRPSSFSMKYKSSATPPDQEVPEEKRESRVLHPPGSRPNKKPNTTPKTGHRTTSTGSPKPATKSWRSASNPNAGSASPSSSAFRLSQNGTPDSIGNGQSPKLQRLRDNSSSSNGLPQVSLGMPLSDRMVRSQSFSHFRQRLPGASAIPRSFSFNKVVELAKPLPNTQLCPVRTHGLKPPQCRSRLGAGFEKDFTDHLSAVAPLSGCSMHPGGPQKSLLSSSLLSKPSSLSYRLSHTFSVKPQHPLLGRMNPEITLPGSSQDQGQQFEKSSPADVPDGLEEMSVSSASSDRNEIFEDLLDDFDHLSDQLHNGGAVNVCSESVGGSSVELSPSSSGGTYMWDEEIMEPLGHSTHSHQCIDKSSLTRMDGKKNQEVFDPENDIILTSNLPENGALHSGKMFNWESSKTEEPEQRQSRENHLQNHNWLLVLEGINGSSAGESDGHMLALEECALEQMLQDCSSVKSQLLQLQLLLQIEDRGVNSKEWSEVNSVPCQIKLLKEVTSLREDLKNKDEIITQLQQQHCHHQHHKQQDQQQHHQQQQHQQDQQQHPQQQYHQQQDQQQHHHQKHQQDQQQHHQQQHQQQHHQQDQQQHHQQQDQQQHHQQHHQQQHQQQHHQQDQQHHQQQDQQQHHQQHQQDQQQHQQQQDQQQHHQQHQQDQQQHHHQQHQQQHHQQHQQQGQQQHHQQTHQQDQHHKQQQKHKQQQMHQQQQQPKKQHQQKQQLEHQQLQQNQQQKRQLEHRQQKQQQQQLQLQDWSLSGSGVECVKVEKAHKFTQTPWRPPNTLQKLHPSSPRTSRAQNQEPSAGSGTFNKFNHHRGPQ